MKKTNKNKHKVTSRVLQGIISISSKGVGYVAIDGLEEDPEIDFKHLHTALHGDTVEVLLLPKGKGRLQGEVTKILSRAKAGFVGIIEEENGIYFLKPDDPKMYTDILIPVKFLREAKVNQKAYVKIIAWKDSKKAPEGEVVKVFGVAGEHNAEMNAIVMEKGLDLELPKKVEEEAEKIKKMGLRPEDYKGRRDFRDAITFTIDPSDAKDFDDAISFKEVSGGDYEIGIHIADVTHYVKVGSELDQEASKRATSIYLVDRTIPMLPEILSNDLCSLVPDKDRFTVSAVFIMNKNAQVKSSWFGRTVIHSKKRLTYEEAEIGIKSANAPLHKELSILNNMAKKLTKERFEKGAISIEQEEVKFVLGKDGVPTKVIKKIRGDSNRLIEEFMLLANKQVAQTLAKATKKEGVFVYRIHELPSKEKMEDLAFFLKSLGHKIQMKNGIIPNKVLNEILESLEGKNERDTVSRAITRSMAKAIYSTQNKGHYGLAFEFYTHFTSPIRRYPDMVVHRLLMDYLHGKKLSNEKIKIYEQISRNSSEQEKRATDAERTSIKYKQVEYMSTRVGQTFKGVISGVSEWGIYVEEVETKCEGLIRVRDMEDDFYILNEKKLELVGRDKKKKYRFGDRVTIKVKKVDLERKTIDYVLI